MKWTVPNIAINKGEDAAAVIAAHRAEFIERGDGYDLDREERAAALAEFDRVAAAMLPIIAASPFTVTFSVSSPE